MSGLGAVSYSRHFAILRKYTTSSPPCPSMGDPANWSGRVSSVVCSGSSPMPMSNPMIVPPVPMLLSFVERVGGDAAGSGRVRERRRYRLSGREMARFTLGMK